MRQLPLIFFVLILFQSCQQKQRREEGYSLTLTQCDSVAMIYYDRNDTLRYMTSDSLEIAALMETIALKNDNIANSCKPAGRLLYKRDGKLIFSAEFSTPDTNDSLNCNYIVYAIAGREYKHKLTDRAGMFIDDIWWGKLKWSSLVNHGPIRLHGDTAPVKNEFEIRTNNR